MVRVLVTAGGAGIGLAIARAFHRDGARVCVCDVDAAALRRAEAALPGLHGIPCDVGDRAAVEAAVADATAWLGGLDVLVNNAGIGGPTCPAQEVRPQDWDAVLRVNLTGAFEVTRHAIPHLIRAGGGTIINMSSAAGRFGYAGRSPYAATKWALIGLTKTWSIELGAHDIRVNAIAPGAVEGERADRVFEARALATGASVDDVRRVAMTNQSLKRLVSADEIAALAVFLASAAGRSISGQVFPIDGDMQQA